MGERSGMVSTEDRSVEQKNGTEMVWCSGTFESFLRKASKLQKDASTDNQWLDYHLHGTFV